jgi:hypothetical protein
MPMTPPLELSARQYLATPPVSIMLFAFSRYHLYMHACSYLYIVLIASGLSNIQAWGG